jgi:hypothetical protein
MNCPQHTQIYACQPAHTKISLDFLTLPCSTVTKTTGELNGLNGT